MTARFDGRAHWRQLSAEAMEDIGAVAIELVAAWHCERRAFEDGDVLGANGANLDRGASAADVLLIDLLRQSVADNIDETAFNDETGFPLLPAMLGPTCRVCGCSQMDACQPFSCCWVEADLCSACVPAGAGP